MPSVTESLDFPGIIGGASFQPPTQSRLVTNLAAQRARLTRPGSVSLLSWIPTANRASDAGAKMWPEGLPGRCYARQANSS